ncbi:unnamed protein product, partial [Symbiodinium microadriaticum]
MLTQYDELRAARGRTIALEHDTTQDDINLSRLTEGTGTGDGSDIQLANIPCLWSASGVDSSFMTSVGMRGDEFLDRPSPASRRARLSLSLQSEAASGIDLQVGDEGGAMGRVSDVELMRGDRRASLRSSLLSRSRVSVSTIGGPGMDDEIPAFHDQDFYRDEGHVDIGQEQGGPRGGLNLDEFEDAGGMVSFDDAHSQLLYSQEGLGLGGEGEGEEGDRAARLRGGEEFRLSLLSGGELELDE